MMRKSDLENELKVKPFLVLENIFMIPQAQYIVASTERAYLRFTTTFTSLFRRQLNFEVITIVNSNYIFSKLT